MGEFTHPHGKEVIEYQEVVNEGHLYLTLYFCDGFKLEIGDDLVDD